MVMPFPGGIGGGGGEVVRQPTHPRTARRDTTTNDFLAVLTMPAVAVAHFFSQIYSVPPDRRRRLFSSRNRDDIRAVAAEMGMWGYDLEYGGTQSMLVRPYLFQSKTILELLVVWYGLMVGVYFVEMAWGVLRIVVVVVSRGREVEEGRAGTGGASEAVGRVLGSGRVSAATGVVVSGASVWIKFGDMYPAGWRFHAFRFIPRGVAGMGDLDQVVAVLGGLMTLGFTGWDVYKSRRAGRRDDERMELRVLRQ